MTTMGRRPKLTPELQAAICEKISAIGGGDELFFADACRLAGVGVSTAYLWLKKGREQRRGKFRDFLEACEHARTQSFVGPLAKIRQAGNRDWKALEAWLRIAHPKRANPQVQVHISSEFDAGLDRLAVEFKDEPDILERAFRALDPTWGAGELAAPPESDRSESDRPGAESDRSESGEGSAAGRTVPGQPGENTEES